MTTVLALVAVMVLFGLVGAFIARDVFKQTASWWAGHHDL
jgi:hypothetical protein